ncbi:MAG: hypothetical protein JNL87_20520 [Burkholderiaceae bacterium]|nr:hypothetical protein [Burkholderiaceae bacterium]
MRALPLAGALLLGLPAGAQTAAADGKAAARPAARTVPAAKPAQKPAQKPATPREQLKSQAEGLALATTTVEAISDAQLDIASRVLTGTADCEFKQQVTVQPVAGQPGFFDVGYKGQRFTMVPEETSTGAVRLEDKRAGVVWLQIPTKSMLMNSKLGQRMVDACQQDEQRVAVNAAAGAAASIGIAPGGATDAAPPVATSR